MLEQRVFRLFAVRIVDDECFAEVTEDATKYSTRFNTYERTACHTCSSAECQLLLLRAVDGHDCGVLG